MKSPPRLVFLFQIVLPDRSRAGPAVPGPRRVPVGPAAPRRRRVGRRRGLPGRAGSPSRKEREGARRGSRGPLNPSPRALGPARTRKEGALRVAAPPSGRRVRRGTPSLRRPGSRVEPVAPGAALCVRACVREGTERKAAAAASACASLAHARSQTPTGGRGAGHEKGLRRVRRQPTSPGVQILKYPFSSLKSIFRGETHEHHLRRPLPDAAVWPEGTGQAPFVRKTHKWGKKEISNL